MVHNEHIDITSTATWNEVMSQPAVWPTLLDHVRDQQGFSLKGERVALVGCGTSYFLSLFYALEREAAGQGITDAWIASQFSQSLTMIQLRNYDRVIFISRSGTTSEVVTAMKTLRSSDSRATIVAITCKPQGPMAQYADHVIDCSVADDSSVVQTRSATGLALAMLQSLGKPLDLSEAAQQVLDNGLPQAVLSAQQWTFIGLGSAYGLALEAGLKMRESCQTWCESYNAMEYRHGPISIAAPGRVVWAFGELPAGLEQEIQATGAFLYHTGQHPIVDLVGVHYLALQTASTLGLNPDSPRNLSRSVILQ